MEKFIRIIEALNQANGEEHRLWFMTSLNKNLTIRCDYATRNVIEAACKFDSFRNIIPVNEYQIELRFELETE